MFFSVRLFVFKMQGFNSLKNFSFYLSKWCFCAPRINEQKELVVLIFLSSDILMFLYAAHRNREKITYYPNFLFWGTCLHVYLFTCLQCIPVYLSTPVCMSTFLHIYCIPVYLSTCLPVYLSTCLLVYLSTCLPVYLSTCLPVYLSTCLPVYLSTCLPVYLSTCLPVYLSTCLPVYLSLCLGQTVPSVY